MTRVFMARTGLAVWLSGCVSLPESPPGTLDGDASAEARLSLDGGAYRPPEGDPYAPPACATAGVSGAQHADPGAVGWAMAGSSGQTGAMGWQPGAGATGGIWTGEGQGGDAGIEGPTNDAGGREPGSPPISRPSQAGDVVITELMIDPAARRDDAGEWIELWNARPDVPLSLEGCAVDDGGSAPRVLGALTLRQGGIAVIARGPQAGVVADATLALSLANTSDTVALICDGIEIDRVTYGPGYPLRPGASLSLDPSAYDHMSNDRSDAWCIARHPYATGDLGTPGEINPPCHEPEPEPEPDSEPDAGAP